MAKKVLEPEARSEANASLVAEAYPSRGVVVNAGYLPQSSDGAQPAMVRANALLPKTAAPSRSQLVPEAPAGMTLGSQPGGESAYPAVRNIGTLGETKIKDLGTKILGG